VPANWKRFIAKMSGTSARVAAAGLFLSLWFFVDKAPACVGDCDSSGSVGVDELIRGVSISLGEQQIDTCLVFDRDANGGVGISELVAAVGNALGGCPTLTPQPEPTAPLTARPLTPTVTRSPSPPTPSPTGPPLLRLVQLLREGERGVPPALNAEGVVVSPDGLNVYISDLSRPGLAFRRNLVDGTLQFDFVFGGRSEAVTVSADGNHVYQGNILVLRVFSRNSETGALTAVQEISSEGSGEDIFVSADGQFIYTGGGRSVVVFGRDTDTGELTLLAAGEPPGNRLTFTPNGEFFYAPGVFSNLISIIHRNLETHELSMVGVVQDDIEDPVNGVDGLFRVSDVVLSPDLRHLYSLSPVDRAIVVFDRNAAVGSIDAKQTLRANLFDDMLMLPHGEALLATTRDAAVSVLQRDKQTGLVRQIFTSPPITTTIGRLALGPQGKTVYVTGNGFVAVLAYEQEAE